MKTSTLAAHTISLFGYSHNSDAVGIYSYAVWLAPPGISTSSALWQHGAVSVDVHHAPGSQTADASKLYSSGLKVVEPSPITPAVGKVVTTDGNVLTVADAPSEPLPPMHTHLPAICIGREVAKVYPVWTIPAVRVPSGARLIERGFPDVPLSIYVVATRLFGSALATTAGFSLTPLEVEAAELVDVINTVDIKTAVPIGVTTASPLPITFFSGPAGSQQQEIVTVTSTKRDGKAAPPLWAITDTNLPY